VNCSGNDIFYKSCWQGYLLNMLIINGRSVKRISVSQDGDEIELVFSIEHQDPAHIRIPSEELDHLLVFVTQAITQRERARQSDPNKLYILPCEWWNVATTSDGQWVVMSYRIEGGAEITFRLHPEAANQVREALGTLLSERIQFEGNPQIH
jgi:hypothetical protein